MTKYLVISLNEKWDPLLGTPIKEKISTEIFISYKVTEDIERIRNRKYHIYCLDDDIDTSNNLNIFTILNIYREYFTTKENIVTLSTYEGNPIISTFKDKMYRMTDEIINSNLRRSQLKYMLQLNNKLEKRFGNSYIIDSNNLFKEIEIINASIGKIMGDRDKLIQDEDEKIRKMERISTVITIASFFVGILIGLII